MLVCFDRTDNLHERKYRPDIRGRAIPFVGLVLIRLLILIVGLGLLYAVPSIDVVRIFNLLLASGLFIAIHEYRKGRL